MIKLRLLYVFFGIAFLSLLFRLFYWQVIRARDLAFAARSQYESGKKITAPRGYIYAKDGTWLAARGEVWTVFAWLPDIKDINKVADTLAPYLIAENDDENLTSHDMLFEEAGRIKTLLGRNDVNWVPLKKLVDKELKEKIEALSITGIGFEPEETRVYPEASSAAHLLGFVGKNDEGEPTGYFGLEGFYNLPLSGKEGFLKEEKDAIGSPIFPGSSLEISAIGGVDLVTNINKSIQLSLDKKLLEGIEKYGAKAASAIVMDPKGAILGASSFPSFEPGKYYDYGNEFFKNPVVTDSFEPGSIFKVIVMAIGLDDGVVEPDTKCGICDKPLKIDKYEIETWDKKYHPDSTMTEVLVNSDNVGMSFIAKKLGSDKMYDYLDRFGFGRPTEVDLQGEISGSLRPRGSWNNVDLVTSSFGQGISVTPIQMTKAVSVIANGGYEVTPQVVDKLTSLGWQEDIPSKIGQKVLGDKAVKEITAMMVESAEHGESKWTTLKGFKVAGKTGTAQIPIAGHYDEEKTNASFVGFAPADNPKFVMLVTLREPESSPWASETAAPLWYDIAKDIFLQLGIQPEN